MSPASKLVLSCLLIVSALTSPVWAKESSNPTHGSAIISIELRDGLLTAEIHDAPLHQVLFEIGKMVGFKTVQVTDFRDFPLVNASFENLVVNEAVERLVANTNRIVFYTHSDDGAHRRVISQVWLLEPGVAGADSTQSIVLDDDLQNEEALKRSEAVLRLTQQPVGEPILEKLAGMLQTDEDPLVRSRVAIALGALKDERAVSDLESALLDAHFSVRAQSIAALGQIGGERATIILGSILLNDGIDPVERVLAAQALWKQDSETALNYLQAGTSNSNEQVRMASSKSPSSPVTPDNSPQPGLEVTE